MAVKPITGYNIYQRQANQEPSTPVTASPLSPATTRPATGLTNATTYYFTVKAVNIIGAPARWVQRSVPQFRPHRDRARRTHQRLPP